MKIEEFDSAEQFVREVTERPVNEQWEGHERDSRSKGREDWYGTDSYEAALNKAREGYDEVASKMLDHMDAACAAAYREMEHAEAVYVSDFVGSTPNVTRAILGLPKDMRRVDWEPREVQAVELVYTINAHCGISTDEIIKAGSEMVALVRLYERFGIPTKLTCEWSVEGCRTDGELISARVTLKDFGTVIDMPKIAFWFAHPSALRRMMFSWLETTPVVTKHHYGYGYPAKQFDLEPLKKEAREHGIIWLCREDFDLKTAADWFKELNE